jgi:hypothetical protein
MQHNFRQRLKSLMLQKSRFSRIQLYHFDPTNAASEQKKDRENYAKTAFLPT